MTKRKRILVRCCAIAMLAVFVFSLTMAGGNEVYATSDRGIADYLNNRELLDGTTITIFHLNDPNSGTFDRYGIRAAAQMYMMQNRGIIIDIRRFADTESLGEALLADFIAGTLDDVLIDSRAIDWRNPSVSADFVDWFETMQTDPNFNEADWFTNAFDAMAIDGRLTAFPRGFLFGMIGANSEVAGLVDALAQYETITNADLLRLHETFGAYRPHLYHSHNSVHTPIYHLYEFLDIEAGRVEFDSEEFIDLIVRSNNIPRSNSPFLQYADGFELPFSTTVGGFSLEGLRNLSEDYLFLQYIAPHNLMPFFRAQQPYVFAGNVPMVDTDGNLLIVHTEPAFLLSPNATTAQQAVAWDFMQFLQNPENTLSISRMRTLPVYKPLFHHEIGLSVRDDIAFFENPMRDTIPIDLSMENPVEYYIERITEILYALANEPMRHIQPFGQAIEDIIVNTMTDFGDGLISAEQAAEYLQSRIENYIR